MTSPDNGDLRRKIAAFLAGEESCFIATTDGKHVDNAMVSYCADGLTLYFGSFTDTLKGRFIARNGRVAVCVGGLQIHGEASLIERSSADFEPALSRYLKRFPSYASYFEYRGNELFRIEPWVLWLFDSSRGLMHRDRLVLNPEYCLRLQPYEPPARFALRERP